MAVVALAGPVWSQELPLGFLHGCKGPGACASPAFPGALAENWNGSGAAESQNGAILHAGGTGSNFIYYATVQGPTILFFFTWHIYMYLYFSF